MPFVAEDRVRDVSTTTGTGTITVTGTPPLKYRTFDDVLATNDTFAYLILHQTANEWEVGLATKSAADQFTRDTVISSSNADALVNFTSGNKDVILVYPPVMTTAQYLANTVGRVLTTDQVNASGALFGLSDGATINWDMANGFNASVTLGGNRTLANPTNTIVGRTGVVVVTQDGTGTRTLAYGTNWEAAGGSFPVLSTAAGAKDAIFYWIQSSTSIIITGILKALA